MFSAAAGCPLTPTAAATARSSCFALEGSSSKYYDKYKKNNNKTKQKQ